MAISLSADVGAVVAAIVCTRIVQARVDRVAASGTTSARPLYDALHTHLPDLRDHEATIDGIPAVLGAWAAAIVVARCVHPRDANADATHQHAAQLRRLFRMCAVALFLRCLTMSLTILPAPAQGASHCIGGRHDCIFSGHTAMMLSLAYFISHAFPMYRVPLFVYCVIGSILIVATRAHYTVDVIVAWIVVLMLVKWV